jgi:hydrogenase expression/formation protein HypC
MCLAVPGKILSTEQREGHLVGKVKFGGITRETYLDLVPDAQVGEYVVVHVGFAISRLNAEEAERTFRLLEAMGLLEDEGLAGASDPVPQSEGTTR